MLRFDSDFDFDLSHAFQHVANSAAFRWDEILELTIAIWELADRFCLKNHGKKLILKWKVRQILAKTHGSDSSWAEIGVSLSPPVRMVLGFVCSRRRFNFAESHFFQQPSARWRGNILLEDDGGGQHDFSKACVLDAGYISRWKLILLGRRKQHRRIWLHRTCRREGHSNGSSFYWLIFDSAKMAKQGTGHVNCPSCCEAEVVSEAL